MRAKFAKVFLVKEKKLCTFYLIPSRKLGLYRYNQLGKNFSPAGPDKNVKHR